MFIKYGVTNKSFQLLLILVCRIGMLVADGDSVPLTRFFAFASGLVLPKLGCSHAECRNAATVGKLLCFGGKARTPITVTLFKFAIGLISQYFFI